MTENNGHGPVWGLDFRFEDRHDNGDWMMDQRGLGDGICDVYYVKIDDLVDKNGGR